MKFIKITLFINLLLISFGAFAANITLSSSENWDSRTVSDHITVPFGMVLTINPGAVINFTETGKITVRGGIMINGTPSNRIAINKGFIYVTDNDRNSGAKYCDFRDAATVGHAGLFFQNSPETTVVEHCTFENNSSGVHGGALYYSVVSGSRGAGSDGLIVRHNIFKNNHSGNYGGAIHTALYERNISITIHDNIFENNTANGYAGALSLHATAGPKKSPTISTNVYNNIFSNNTSLSHGGAIAHTYNHSIAYGEVNFHDNLMHHNQALIGGAMYIYGKNITIENNTIAYNKGGLGGICLQNAQNTASFKSNIFWENRKVDNEILSMYLYGDTHTPFDNNITDNGAWSISANSNFPYAKPESAFYYDNRGNSECNPRFVAVPFTEAGNYTGLSRNDFDFALKSNSPAIGTGLNGVDMGAFEFAGTPTTVAPCLGADFEPCVLEVSGLNNDASCLGNDGSIDLTVSGAIGNLTFAWSNGSITEDITGLVAGTYTVTVTDDGTPACSEEQSFTIIATTLGNPIVDLSSESMTNGLTPNGSVEAIVSGGTGTYSFLWNEGSTTEGLVDLSAGIYSVEVVDKGTGCEASGAVEVSDVSPVFGAIELSPCPPKGTLNFIVRSGVGPFVAKVSKSHHITGASEGYIRLDWEKHEEVSFAGGVEVSLLLDTKGDYSLEVYDGNNELVLVYSFSVTNSTWNKDCTPSERGRGKGKKRVGSFDETMDVESVEGLSFKVYPNPVSNELNVVIPTDLEGVQLEVINALGMKVMNLNVTSTNEQLDVSTLSEGIYIIRIIQGNNLINQKSFIVIE